ncbi:hypothetical protein D0Z07_8048 [Hyphodiscus hymeniophilus]|uniref:Uncharacterized protein n=1 Tax=Hyphodiscus hymeniophilus TaxID=353542 RepID=A0A9P6SNN8_9HELO|nr:hypothetical protein D0Z07_8048 [Hyphodiscus hymeniophilus]
MQETSGNSASAIPIDTDKAIDKGIIVDTADMDSSAIMVENGVDDDEDLEVYSPFPKRKRISINYNLDEPGYDKVVEPIVKRSRNGPKIRGVIIGVWRDSNEPDDADKHVIFGFIDIHDRLRTRIYGMNRRGEELIGNIPTGAGGCWVTFPRVIFDSHLKDLNPAEVKEYVRIRSESKTDTDPEAQNEADQKAVLKAKAAAARLEGTPKPVVHRQSLGRQPSKKSLARQSLGSPSGFKAVNAANVQTPKASPSTETIKPSGVLLGYWSGSSESRVEDKHAAYGVLGGSDCFRVKVARITRDGRYVDGNFPVGAGALWLHYDQVVLDPPLQSLTRLEVKEYVRIRQQDQAVESDRERKVNEQRAIREAKDIVATDTAPNGVQNGLDQGQASPEMEVRHSARSELRMAAKQQAEAEAGAELRRKEKSEARDRQNEKTRREVAQAEAVIQEAAQAELKNNLKKLNKVWVAQQAAIPGSSAAAAMPPVDEIKYHNGIKYERKQNGPFQGKLVSSAQILSIDGEDYVEYRVLTKPSFF